MEKLNINEKQAKNVIPIINELIDEVNTLKKQLKGIKEVLLENFDRTGYLADLGLHRKKDKKKLDN